MNTSGMRHPSSDGCAAQTSIGNQRKIQGASSKMRASISRESRAFSAVVRRGAGAEDQRVERGSDEEGVVAAGAVVRPSGRAG